MTIPLLQVDAFANLAYTGNPAAVALLEAEPSASWMQRLAAEMNLSETAFLWPGGESFGLRWFTPTMEVDLCGHATLAAAHVLFESERVDGDAITFETNSGDLVCEREDAWIRMAFPSHPPEGDEAQAEDIARALDAKPTWVGESEFDLFAVLEDERSVRELEPDLDLVEELDGRGLIVTAPADDESEVDFVSRYFAPAFGIDEDPVTGSAHCALGPYWAERLDRDQVVGRQVSRRGGLVRVEVTGDGVHLEGQAITVFEGELTEAAGPR